MLGGLSDRTQEDSMNDLFRECLAGYLEVEQDPIEEPAVSAASGCSSGNITGRHPPRGDSPAKDEEATTCWAGMLANIHPPRAGPLPCGEWKGRPNGLYKHTCDISKTDGIYMDVEQRARLFAVDAGKAELWKCSDPKPTSPFGIPKQQAVRCKLIAQSNIHPAILVLAPGALFGPTLPEGVQPLFDAKEEWFDERGGLPLVATGSPDRFTFRPQRCEGWQCGKAKKQTAAGSEAAASKPKSRAGASGTPGQAVAAAAGFKRPAGDMQGTNEVQAALGVFIGLLEQAKQKRGIEPPTSNAWHIADREVDALQKAVDAMQFAMQAKVSWVQDQVGGSRAAGNPSYRSCSTKSLSGPSVKQEEDDPVYRGGVCRGGSALDRAEEDDDDEPPRMRSLGGAAADAHVKADPGAETVRRVIAALEAWALDADDYEVAKRLASRRSKLE